MVPWALDRTIPEGRRQSWPKSPFDDSAILVQPNRDIAEKPGPMITTYHAMRGKVLRVDDSFGSISKDCLEVTLLHQSHSNLVTMISVERVIQYTIGSKGQYRLAGFHAPG
jgi:hypothetical protein